MAILLAHSTSGIASGKKKVCRNLKMTAILKYWTQLQFGLRYEKIISNYAKKNFNGDDIINDVTGRTECRLLYSCLKEVGSGSKLQGQCPTINENIIIIFLGYTNLKKISISNTFWDCRSKLNIAGLLSDFNGHNSISLGILKMEPKLKCKK